MLRPLCHLLQVQVLYYLATGTNFWVRRLSDVLPRQNANAVLDVLTSFARAFSQASNYITCHSVAQLGVTLARLDVDWLAVNLAPCLHVLFAPLEKCRYSSAVCLRGLCSPHVFHDAYPSVAGRPAPTPRAFRASQRNRAYNDSSWRPRWAKPLHRCANPRCGGPSAGSRRYTQETCHLS